MRVVTRILGLISIAGMALSQSLFAQSEAMPDRMVRVLLDNRSYTVYGTRHPRGRGDAWCYSPRGQFEAYIAIFYKNKAQVVALNDDYRREVERTIVPALRQSGCPPRGSELALVNIQHFVAGVPIDNNGRFLSVDASGATGRRPGQRQVRPDPGSPLSSVQVQFTKGQPSYGEFLTPGRLTGPISSVAELEAWHVIPRVDGDEETDVPPLHNAHQLLAETNLVRVHARRQEEIGSTNDKLWCSKVAAKVSLVFKVDDHYEVSDSEAYWNAIEGTVAPVVAATCPQARWIDIQNYVLGYRLDVTSRIVEPGAEFLSPVEVPLSTARFESATGLRMFHRLRGQVSGPRVATSVSDARRIRSEVEAEQQRRTSVMAQRAEERAAHDRWTYTTKGGFQVSDSLLAREAEAHRIVARMGVVEGLAAVLGGPQKEPLPGEIMTGTTALTMVAAAARRSRASEVVATLDGWTQERLSSALDVGSQEDAELIRDAFVGNFEPWLGAAPSHPNGMVPARQLELDTALLAFHDAYSAQCRASTRLPWRSVAYSIDTVSTTAGFTIRTPGERQTFEVRAPFYETTVARLETRTPVQTLGQFQQELVVRPRMIATFRQLLRTTGCDADSIRQLEVNLYLMVEGLPPLQVILPAL